MVVSAKITSKGQITLPRAVRKDLNVSAGNVIIFEKEEDKVVLRPAKTLKEFKGFLKSKAKADFDETRKKAKQNVGKRAARGGNS